MSPPYEISLFRSSSYIKGKNIELKETIVIELGKALQYKCATQIPNFGFVIMELSAAGKDPSREPIPDILQAIESSAKSWIKADLRNYLLEHMGPQLMSPRADRLPEFRYKVKDPLEFAENVSLRGHDFACRLTMANVPKIVVGVECVAGIQAMMRDELMLSAKELSGATA